MTIKRKSNVNVGPANIFPNRVYGKFPYFFNCSAYFIHVVRDSCNGVNGIILHDDVIKWKNFPRYWPFVRGIHRSPVNSPHKGQWRGALMFSLICVWINGWVNNREAGDLRCYIAHYDVTVMEFLFCKATHHAMFFSSKKETANVCTEMVTPLPIHMCMFCNNKFTMLAMTLVLVEAFHHTTKSTVSLSMISVTVNISLQRKSAADYDELICVQIYLVFPTRTNFQPSRDSIVGGVAR